jgi:hypothetical protein
LGVESSTTAALWLTVMASGVYHGINPAMGWPLAVSAGLMEKTPRALLAAFMPLSAGHLMAILLVILPFTMLLALVEWQWQIQAGASVLLIGFGMYRLVSRRHPRSLSRIRPTHLALWSCAVAMAHGAGLMLVPIYLGLCGVGEIDAGHTAARALMNASLGTAVLVGLVHTLAMVSTGAACGWLVYRYLGLGFISRSWFNLDVAWAVSLIAVGIISAGAWFTHLT